MAMKGMKNPKALSKLTDKDMAKMLMEDMASAKKRKVLEEQKAEFESYLKQKLAARPDNEFFGSMLQKIERGYELTENMVSAIRKCMKQDAQKDQPVDESKCPTATFHVKAFWAKEHNLCSRVITGKVLRETAKAYLIKGHTDIKDDLVFCACCGKELTNAISRILRIGPICAQKNNISIPSDCGEAEMERLKGEVFKVLRNQQFELWLPKSQIKETLDWEEPKEEAKPKRSRAKKVSK